MTTAWHFVDDAAKRRILDQEAEIDRLRAVNAELLAALTSVLRWNDRWWHRIQSSTTCADCYEAAQLSGERAQAMEKARAAIAKATQS